MNLETPSGISVVLSSGDPNVIQLYNLLNVVLDDLLDEYDWQFLQKRETFSTVPNQEAYSFPSDYVRAMNGTFFDASNRWEIKIVTAVQWEIINIWNVTASPFSRLRIFGNQLNFYPIPGAAYNFVYDYISNNCIQNGSTGALQSSFKNDSDVILFDSRLVINALKYKYLSSVGNDTTDALAQYERILEMKKGQDAPSPKLSLRPQPARLISTANIPDGNWTA